MGVYLDAVTVAQLTAATLFGLSVYEDAAIGQEGLYVATTFDGSD